MNDKEKWTYQSQQTLELVNGGSEYFTYLRRAIDAAKQTIHIQMYIFTYDETGQMVLDWLYQAASRGVFVYILVDGYASRLPDQLKVCIKSPGLYVKYYEPLFRVKSFNFGRRLHHKCVVTDGRLALVGSNNIDNHYSNINMQDSWKDWSLYVEGSIAGQLEAICIQLWNRTDDRKYGHIRPTETKISSIEDAKEGVSVRVSRNDWAQNRKEIWESYFNILNKAREKVYLVSSYFLPGKRLRKQMKLASQRGVKVKVIAAGLSDVRIAKYAERFLYPWLLHNGIEIYEYQRGILHAKLGIRDRRCMTLGSYNINNISAYASMELNLDVRNQNFVGRMTGQLEHLIEMDCVRITEKEFVQQQSLYKRLIQRLCYNLVQMLVFLFTFYIRRPSAYSKN